MNPRQSAYAAWAAADVPRKLSLTRALVVAGNELDAIAGQPFTAEAALMEPGRPQRPVLVPPLKVKQRNAASKQGRAALIHAIAHIEFNAVNLALDAVWRFSEMPAQYYQDWIKVAQEEAHHFTLLCNHLGTLGHEYGDMPAHDGLWDMARRTAHDVLHRMALIPRVLEARGLDASPAIRDKLLAVGDRDGAAIIDLLLADEIGHVAIGTRWYHWLCAQRGCDAEVEFLRLVALHAAPRLRGEINVSARLEAGFSTAELTALAANPEKRISAP